MFQEFQEPAGVMDNSRSCDMLKSLLRSLLALSALFPAAGLYAACAQIGGMQVAGISERLVDIQAIQATRAGRHIEPLKGVYARLAAAANARPALVICSGSELGGNAVAMGDVRKGLVVFDLPMLELLDGKADEMAAVMAHEFGHLLLNHTSQKLDSISNLTLWAGTVAQQHYQQTGNVENAIALGKKMRAIELAKFSRTVEREADDKGFSLAVTLARFNADSFKSFALKLSKLPPSTRPPYLEDHPGWLERFEKADLLALNQQYVDSAQTLFSKGDWKPLSDLLKVWLRQIPASGTAWYYQGRVLARTSRSPSRISKAFEESASLYVENPVLGVHSQEDLAEAADVWFHLCLALFDEGYKFESANCSRRISSEARRENFQARTFGSQLIVGGAELPPGSLFVANMSGGRKLITNETSVAAAQGAYKPLSPVWKAIRYPEALPR